MLPWTAKTGASCSNSSMTDSRTRSPACTMKSAFSKILNTILGMHRALAGTCVSAIKPTVLDALRFAISREIIVSSLVIVPAFFQEECMCLRVLGLKDNKYSRLSQVVQTQIVVFTQII